MSQAPEISGQATDPNFQAPDSFSRPRFQDSPTQVEQPTHIPIVKMDGYYPAINAIDPDRMELVIGADLARFASKAASDTIQSTTDEQLKLGLAPVAEKEARDVRLLAEMTVYVASPPMVPAC